MKDLMSVLRAVDYLDGEPGHATHFIVQPGICTSAHYLIRCSVRRSF
jgi:hypothetical protein